MNIENQNDELAPSDALREIIRNARDKSGKTEKQINRDYLKSIIDKGGKPIAAIMTKMRDKRQEIDLSKTEAKCLAEALNIDPRSLYSYTREEPAPQFPYDDDEVAPAQEDPTPAQEVKSNSSRKVSVGIYETEKGLQFLINMFLDKDQLERLTLAIPAYMMKIEQTERGFLVRGQVKIFPYQAHLLMRAIYGGN